VRADSRQKSVSTLPRSGRSVGQRRNKSQAVSFYWKEGCSCLSSLFCGSEDGQAETPSSVQDRDAREFAAAGRRGKEMFPATSKNLFEQCRLSRYQAALRLACCQARPLIAVLGVMDRMCLDQAVKYLLDRSASSGIQRQLLDGEASFPILPPGPVWLQLRDPQPLDHWSEAQFAALYFYPPLAPLTLRRVSKGLHLPGLLPAIWRLDVLNPNGDLLLSYQFEAEQRRWKITAGHRCQWNECVESISGEAKVVVNPCPQCKSDMDYCVRWLTAVLLMVANCNDGQSSPIEEEVYQVMRQGRGWHRRAKQVAVELRYIILRTP
jgi:hypothetical protein